MCMPEMKLFMTEKDELELIRFVLGQECWLIPDIDYDSPRHQNISTERQFRDYRKRARLFFIVRDDILKSPLEMRRISKDGRTVFYIGQRRGGPTIDFLTSGTFIEKDQRFIRPGSLGHHPTYWNTLERKMVKPPAKFREVNKHLSRFVRETARHLVVERHSIWLWTEAEKEVRRGAKLVGFEMSSLLLATRT